MTDGERLFRARLRRAKAALAKGESLKVAALQNGFLPQQLDLWLWRTLGG